MKRKKQRSIKTRAFSPFIGQFLHAIAVYVFTPILLFVVMIAVLRSYGAFFILLLLLGVLVYFVFVLEHFKPGVQVLRDTIFNNFETREIKYEDNIISRYNYFPLLTKQSEGDFLEVYCQIDNNQRLALCASRYHGMIPGEKYVVKYGKCSKVLISILSKSGEELWDVPPDEWRGKSFSNLTMKNK